MAVAAAEIYEYRPDLIEGEKHGLSMRSLRDLGRISRLGYQAEVEDATEQLRMEFETVVFEGLKSDREFGEELQVEDFDSREVVNGRIMAKDGKTDISAVLLNGLNSAIKEAKNDPRMQVQVERAIRDNDNGKIVSSMVNGATEYNTRIVVSAHPKEAISKDGEKYWKDVGYIKGLNYIQLYHVSDDGDDLVAGSISFMASLDAIRGVLADEGVEIPEDEHSTNYITHAITGNMNLTQAKNLALKLREKAENKAQIKKINTAEVFDNNRMLMDKIFNNLVIPIGDSLDLGYPTNATQDFANSYLQSSTNLNSETSRTLIRVANKAKFTSSEARVLYQLAAYSAIEALRFTLSYDNSGSLMARETPLFIPLMNDPQSYDYFAQFMQAGVQAGRNYAGCGSSINLGDNQEQIFGLRQNSFGGLENDDSSAHKSSDRCVNCPSCRRFHERVRKVAGRLVCDNPSCRLSDKPSTSNKKE